MDQSSLDDSELLCLMQTGKEWAFSEIYRRYWEKLLAVGYYHMKNKEAAKEIVHDVLLSLWLRRETLVIQSLPAYLGTAVKFSVLKAITREKRQQELLAGNNTTLETVAEEEEKLDAKFLKDFLAGEVEKLPEKTRLVFKYSREEHLSMIEVADKLDISLKTVEYHISRALKTLRSSLRRFYIFLLPAAFTIIF